MVLVQLYFFCLFGVVMKDFMVKRQVFMLLLMVAVRLAATHTSALADALFLFKHVDMLLRY